MLASGSDAGEIEEVEADHGGDDGREHDAEHAEVAAVEDSREAVGAAEAGALEHEAEPEAHQDRDHHLERRG